MLTETRRVGLKRYVSGVESRLVLRFATPKGSDGYGLIQSYVERQYPEWERLWTRVFIDLNLPVESPDDVEYTIILTEPS